jgi:Ca2+/H+ antiporter
MPLASSLVLAVSLCAVVALVCWHANKINIRVMDQNARMTSAVLSLSKNKAAEQLAAQIENTTGGAISTDAASRFSHINGEEQLHDLERSFPTGL